MARAGTVCRTGGDAHENPVQRNDGGKYLGVAEPVLQTEDEGLGSDQMAYPGQGRGRVARLRIDEEQIGDHRGIRGPGDVDAHPPVTSVGLQAQAVVADRGQVRFVAADEKHLVAGLRKQSRKQ